MNGIFLDDERQPEDVYWMKYPEVEWYVQSRAVDFLFCISQLDNEVSDYIFSFDHDIQSYGLDGVEITGYDCLKHLVDFCFQFNYKLPVCYFHSKNGVGSENMICYYDNAVRFQLGEYDNRY